MAVDQTMEFFTYELFNHLLYGNNCINKPLIRKGDKETLVESEFQENILKAVVVRGILFGEFYTSIIKEKYSTFTHSKADFYAFLLQHFPQKEYCYRSVMDKIIALCAFVTAMCSYSHIQGNNLFMADSYLFCAMYIDQLLQTEFDKEGGWFKLSRVCMSYVAPYDFLVECKLPVERGFGINFRFRETHEFIRCINKFRLFIENVPSSEFYTTSNWVNHCLEDVYDQFSQSTQDITRKHYSVEELEALLTDLKFYCDPVESNVDEFDNVYLSAMASKQNPKLFLKTYLAIQQIAKCASEPQSEFLVLESFAHLVRTDSSSPSRAVHQNQNFNFQVDDAETLTQPPFTLSTTENMNKDMNKCVESLEENLRLLYTKLDHSPFSFYVDELSTSGSSLDGFYNFMSSSNAETSSNEKENSVSIQSLTPQFSPERVFSRSLGTPETLENENDIVCEIDNFSNLDTNSVKCSLNYTRSSGVVKMKTQREEENPPNIQTSETKFSPTRTFSGSPNALKISEDKKDQVIGLFSKLDTNTLLPNSIEITPNCIRSSDARKRPGGKENTSKLQRARQKFPPTRLLFTSQSTPPNCKFLKLGKCGFADQIVVHDKPTWRDLNSQDQSPTDSIISEAVKGKIIPEIMENKSKTHTEVLSYNLPQHTSILEEQLTEEKVYHSFSSTNVEYFGEDSFPSALNAVEGNEKVHQKLATVKGRRTRIHAEFSSQTQSGTGASSAPKPFAGKKKKSKKKSKKTKKNEESTHPKPRREHLQETEEYALDILRMTLVMGNRTCLKTIKPTLQYYKNNR